MINTFYPYRPLIFPAAISLFLTLILIFAYFYIGEKQRQLTQFYQHQQAKLVNLHRELSEVEQVNRWFERYFDSSRAIQQQAYWQGQSRVNWIDRFIELAAKHGMDKPSFIFSSRSELELGSLLALDPFNEVLQVEYLDIEGGFQHELSLLSFLSDIQGYVNPISLIDECRISRMHDLQRADSFTPAYAYSAKRGNLIMNCRLKLLVLVIPSKPIKQGGTS
jgi:hypothetical protein